MVCFDPEFWNIEEDKEKIEFEEERPFPSYEGEVCYVEVEREENNDIIISCSKVVSSYQMGELFKSQVLKLSASGLIGNLDSYSDVGIFFAEEPNLKFDCGSNKPNVERIKLVCQKDKVEEIVFPPIT